MWLNWRARGSSLWPPKLRHFASHHEVRILKLEIIICVIVIWTRPFPIGSNDHDFVCEVETIHSGATCYLILDLVFGCTCSLDQCSPWGDINGIIHIILHSSDMDNITDTLVASLGWWSSLHDFVQARVGLQLHLSIPMRLPSLKYHKPQIIELSLRGQLEGVTQEILTFLGVIFLYSTYLISPMWRLISEQWMKDLSLQVSDSSRF